MKVMQSLGVLMLIISIGGQSLEANSSRSIGETETKKLSRGKRYLDFTKGTRMSWRCNVKNNILRVNTLWAYGFGYRVNFPFPDKSERRRPFFKREVFNGITDVLNAHGFDGQACMLKSYCTAHLSSDSELGTGMLYKMLKILFTLCLALDRGKRVGIIPQQEVDKKKSKNKNKPRKRKMNCSQRILLFICGSVLLLPFFTHSLTNAAESVATASASASASASAASLLVGSDQASSSSDTEKEITFISVNGNHINVNTTTTTAGATKSTSIPTTAVNANESPIQSRGHILRRGKRYLDFIETSRMFFRVNVKNNIIPKTTIWAHAYGFRCNYPIENDKKVRPFRRDTYEVLGDLMDQSGFDGQACILKAYCTANMNDGTGAAKGMLFKLLEYIFTLNDEDRKHFPYLHHRNCQQILHSHCPLSFNNISPYTDDV